jgi:hypothetical protein
MSLNFKGQPTYKTTCGALLTILLLVVVGLALVMKGFKSWVIRGSIANINKSPLYYNQEMLAVGFRLNGENPLQIAVTF